MTEIDLVIQFISDREGITRLVAQKTKCNDWTLIGEIKSGQWRRAGNVHRDGLCVA